MAKGGMKLSGAEDLFKKFNSLEDLAKIAVLSRTGRAGAMIIKNRWKRDAPFKTGQYKRSINEEVTKTSKDLVEITIGTDITDPPYPFFLEFGTIRMTARPSAGPAYQASKKRAFRVAQKSFTQLLIKAAK